MRTTLYVERVLGARCGESRSPVLSPGSMEVGAQARGGSTQYDTNTSPPQSKASAWTDARVWTVGRPVVAPSASPLLECSTFDILTANEHTLRVT